MAQKEMYRHVIVNDDLPTAVRELVAIIESYRT
jgi:guanylate kinase